MPAYAIAEMEVTDPATYDEFRKQVPAAIAAFGGRFLVRGGAVDVVEGGWNPSRLVVIEFADMATARRFYESPDYQKIIGLRHRAANSRVIFADGAPPA